MPKGRKTDGGDLLIVDNSDKDWKVSGYLSEWADIAKSFDVATGYFEIGALLALDGQWQKLEKLRILMGDEASRRTKKALLAGIESAKNRLDQSIEREKESNEFLKGVPAIVEALRKKRIRCRVYRKDKFHAKAYITHAKHAVVGPSALVGSSNLTYPGLTQNVELNVQLRREVEILQEWYERHWKDAEEITEDILRVIERHTREYTPFEVYVRALQEFFKGHEMTAGEWELAGRENGGSWMYSVLDQYQKDGYQALMKIARRHRGTFLCDGVGLGKTFIGLMVIERLTMYERKRVALFVPKAAREPVWEKAIRRYLPHVGCRDFSNLAIFNHTDLGRGGEFEPRLERIREFADAIVVDEAHHFRNPGVKGEGAKKPSRYWQFYHIAKGKNLFMLTATPVNNKLIDFRHMIELFSQHQEDYFGSAPLGIHSLRGHFIKMENALKKIMRESGDSDESIETNQAEAEKILLDDALFNELVVQRSRAYVKESQEQSESSHRAIFPEREPPKVVDYSIRKTYGRLLEMIEEAFHKIKPLFSLAIYYPLAYYKGPDESIDPMVEGRQKQVVGLIRTQFLKRFESSAYSFEISCETLLIKLLTFITKHSQTKAEKDRLERWKRRHADLIGYIYKHQLELFDNVPEEDQDEDIVSEEMLEAVEELSRDEYKVEEILAETYQDLDQIVEFLKELKKFKPSNDDKLRALIRLLKNNSKLKIHKVLIFTEFMATARYLRRELEKAGIAQIDQVDSNTKRDRGDIIAQFAPYYNDMTSSELEKNKLAETRLLISTDVLSEGLNLQDATFLINYDIHWNPVRLMQRIGRVDRRINPEIEDKIVADHPECKKIRGKCAYWNFLPPEELDELLALYQKVSHKTLRISKTFGVQGKKLLRPEDDYDALKNFNKSYEGSTTALEQMHLEYQKLLKDNPELEGHIKSLPGMVFSGKNHPSKGTKVVFFCYTLPVPEAIDQEGEEVSETERWTEEAGQTAWYLYDLRTESIATEPSEIIEIIRCDPETPRNCEIEKETLSDIRMKIEKHIKNTYLKKVQAPVGVKPKLKAWMELN